MKTTAHAVTASVITAIALAGLSASDRSAIPVFVVLQNRAGVPPQVLGRAIQTVVDAYRPLGVGISWTEEAAEASAVPTVHVTLLRRRAGRHSEARMLGIDAPNHGRARAHVAHVLYQHLDDDVATGHALAYVLAHVIRRAVSNRMTGPARIVHADRRAARAMAKGRSVFTPEEAEGIRRDVELGKQSPSPSPTAETCAGR